MQPLRHNVLVVYAIHFAKIIKFNWPLTIIINKDKFEYLVFTNDLTRSQVPS
jgi:hypothetical protein